MQVRANESWQALTEKEKQTLRLIARGHDAKSTARSLGLSVHTINERLRDARRKMAVSSSREAARLLLETESAGLGAATPKLSGDMEMGEDAARRVIDLERTSPRGVRRLDRRFLTISGVLLMMLALGLSALLFSTQVAAPSAAPADTAVTAPKSEAAEVARRWLALLDGGRWDESYAGTSATFRTQNSAQVWAAASEQARTPLGAMVSRSFLSQEAVPAPPSGYELVKFRTRFANKAAAIETVTLRREEGGWRITGVMID